MKVEGGDGRSPKVTIIPRDEAEIARQRREHWWDAPTPYENYDDASCAPRRLSAREIEEQQWGRFIGTPY